MKNIFRFNISQVILIYTLDETNLLKEVKILWCSTYRQQLIISSNI